MTKETPQKKKSKVVDTEAGMTEVAEKVLEYKGVEIIPDPKDTSDNLVALTKEENIALEPTSFTKRDRAKLSELKELSRTLTKKQKFFCELYATTREFFGNGVQSYIEAYNPDRSKTNWMATARSTSSEILTKPNVLAYINSILELKGLNDAHVDKQLELLVTQNADYKTKLGAIKEYNELKARVNKKIEVSVKGAIAHGHFHVEDDIVEAEITAKYKANMRERIKQLPVKEKKDD